MKKKYPLTRRQLIFTGLGSLGGWLLPGCGRRQPPTYGNLLRMADGFTYSVHRALLPGQSLAKEYSRHDISSFPAIGTTNPGEQGEQDQQKEYTRLRQNGFLDWRVQIEGRVQKPASFSIADLQRLPARTQITRHTCEEGWSAIAEWTGVPLSFVLQSVGILPSARFVSVYGCEGYMECIDMLDAFHPQTILAYGMNGRQLPIQHGAPVRLRVEKQIGYKSIKYVNRILVSDEYIDNGIKGWAWYVGI